MIFQKYPTIMVSCDFRKVTELFDKIHVRPLEILKRVFLGAGAVHNSRQITCSKLTKETLEQGVKYVQS